MTVVRRHRMPEAVRLVDAGAVALRKPTAAAAGAQRRRRRTAAVPQTVQQMRRMVQQMMVLVERMRPRRQQAAARRRRRHGRTLSRCGSGSGGGQCGRRRFAGGTRPVR